MHSNAVTQSYGEVRDYLAEHLPLTSAQRSRRYRRRKQARKASLPHKEKHDLRCYCSVCHLLLTFRESINFGKSNHNGCIPSNNGVNAKDVDYVVVPLPRTRMVKDIPDWTRFYVALKQWWSLDCVYNEPACHIPKRTTGHDSNTTTSKPACMWPGFREKTFAKTRGKLHTIGGRWCKCSECRLHRRNG
jgi:hypothetical protein